MSHPQSPPIGWPIVVCLHGDPQTRCPARVTETAGSPGMLRANYEYPGGGDLLASTYIRHVSDPMLRQRPEIARRDHAWDWIPGLELGRRHEPEADAPEPAEMTRAEQGRMKVLSMADQGVPRDAIARAVRGYGLSAADVERILEPSQETAPA